MDGSNFDLLPPEMKTEVLLKLNLKDLLNFCSTSKSAMEYCKNDQFWKAKYQHDFPNISSTGNLTWEKQYKSLHFIPQSPICAGKNHYAIIDDQSMLYTGDIRGSMCDPIFNGPYDEMAGTYSLKPVHVFGRRDSSAEPVKQKVRSVSCGVDFIGAVTEEGRVYFWGRRLDGIFTNQEEHDATHQRSSKITEPKEFKIPGKAIKIVCGPKSDEVFLSMFAVILEDRSVFLRMDYAYYDFESDSASIKIISTTLNISALDISVNGSGLAIVSTDGKLYYLGDDMSVYDTKYGYQEEPIGIIYKDGQMVVNPVHIPLPEKIKQVSLDYNLVCALSVNGNVYLWRKYKPYKLSFHVPLRSNGVLSNSENFEELPISFITCQNGTTSVIDKNGKLYIWGKDNLRISNSKDIIDNPVQIKFELLDEYGTGDVTIPEDRVNYVAVGNAMVIAITADGWVNIVEPDIS
uniref:Regulator of chromosome condensation protein n=1 Tax=Pithovirus LCPAC202 TaxID=2506592 RepID=A0A481Z662_9VIRU|nr:MAG: regulator of chromosome condensation protein [Pithovirus LCPAC202]